MSGEQRKSTTHPFGRRLPPSEEDILEDEPAPAIPELLSPVGILGEEAVYHFIHGEEKLPRPRRWKYPRALL